MVILYLSWCGINHIIIYVMENNWCGISLEETKYSRCLQRWNYTWGNNTRDAEDNYAGIIRRKLKVSRDLKYHGKETYWGKVSLYISLDFQRSVNLVADPLTKPISHEVFGKHFKATGLRIFEWSFWTSGRCWNYVSCNYIQIAWNC